MNKILNAIKSILYSLPFGLKAADSEIMGSNISGNGNDTTINQQVNDKRVAKHLLKGEITQEVEELRYRTYKVDRESKNYNYIGHGLASKKRKNEYETKKSINIIRFTQENKLICNDILTELNHVDNYGVEKYTVNIDYYFPVRFKFQEFLTHVDVVIKSGEQAVTTLRFSDVRNPQNVKSKPFVTELEKLEALFNNNDTYGLSRNDFATSMLCMNFTTFNASDDHPDVVTYTFTNPELIGVHHEDGEFKLLYKWKEHDSIDLTDKFYNAELEEKYKNKEKKKTNIGIESDDDSWWEEHSKKVIMCSKCGKPIKVFSDGYVMDNKTSEPVCLKCYEKSLLNNVK